jgi:hypothetical protein
MLDVSNVSEIRRDNARALAAECGGMAAFARRIGRADPYISQLIGTNPQRGIGHAMARHIEKVFEKPPGWMDSRHEEGQDPLTDTTILFARWYQSLPAEARDKLIQVAPIVTGSAVPDAVVEARMPATARADMKSG